MAATIKDVARLAGCSIKTVSRVINDEPHVTDAVRTRVRTAVNTLGYTPNLTARRLVQRRSYTICLLLHEAGVYQSAVLSKVMEIGYEYGYDILIQTYFPWLPRSKNQMTSLISERRVDGLVTTPPCDADEFISDLVQKSGIPLVQITPYNRASAVPYVSGDDYQGAVSMTEYLLALGHRRIAFFSGPRNYRTSIDRFNGYRDALFHAQVRFDPAMVQDSEFNFDGGYTAARIVMGLPEPPTALFAGNDEAALGAMYALQELGKSIPNQVSVCGFDDVAYSKNVWPGLTTVHQPIGETVELATYMLLDILSGKEPERSQVVLPAPLVVRGSTAPPAK